MKEFEAAIQEAYFMAEMAFEFNDATNTILALQEIESIQYIMSDANDEIWLSEYSLRTKTLNLSLFFGRIKKKYKS